MLTRTPEAALAAPLAARISGQLALVLWQAPGGGDTAFRPHLGRTALPRPHAAIRLDASAALHAGLVLLPRALPADGMLLLGQDARTAPAVALDSIGATPDALGAGLPPSARARLLAFLLDMGVGLFRKGDDPGFVRSCQLLAATLAGGEDSEAPRAARIVASLPGGLQLIVVPTTEATGAWHLLGTDAARRVRAAPAVRATQADGAFHLLVRNAAAGDMLVPAGGGMPWRVQAPAGTVPHLLGWLRGAGPAVAAAVGALLHADDTILPDARPALLREIALLAPRAAIRHDDVQAPVAAALDLSIPDGQGGVFLRGWLSDPHALVRTTTLLLPQGPMPLATGTLRPFPRQDLATRLARSVHGGAVSGFVAHVPDVGGEIHQPALVLGLGSGADIHLVAPARALAAAAARDAVLASVPPDAVDATLMEACLAPAAARLHAAVMAAPRTPDIVRIGPQPKSPRLSVLIPLYRTLSFLRAQVAAFAGDPDWRDVETIFVLDSPEQRFELEHLLRGLSLMHGLGFVLVVMPRNLGYAAANNEGAAIARAKLLLLLNSDVVPDRGGWLRPMLAALDDRRTGAAGPKLLFEDASIQHAGLLFDRDTDGMWFNRHYHKGFPRGFAPANRARAVPAVTGAALLLRRFLFESVGAVCEDYIIGDYEDSDLCLKLRGTGASIAYVPAAELWHFERRSIRAHPGYARTLASLYNRRLHHARWDATIGALMQRFPRRDVA